jgi:hypothetical protein
MTRRSTGSRWTGTILSMGLLAGCAPGLMGGDNRSDPALDRILVSDSNVPTKQGLLFMAMRDAEVARQSAGFALAAAEPADAKAQINNVLYAIDPAFPPTPTVTASGVTAFWPPTGYGLRHSMQDIAEEMRAVSSRHDSRPAVAAQAQEVTVCTEETLSRVDRLVSLSQQALDAGSAAELAPLLAEIDRLAHIVLEAPAAQAVDACSLEDAKKGLHALALQIA